MTSGMDKIKKPGLIGTGLAYWAAELLGSRGSL
jgi:hypothetical protein